MTQAQKWLDENYPYSQRKNITKIETGEKDLEGPLKIEGFINLVEICCGYNQLNSLEIINCPNLKLLSCENNQITDLKIDSCHELTGLYCCHNKLTNLDLSENKKINILSLDDNNFPEQDLSFLSHLVNLERLQLGNIMSWTNKEENGENTYNRFSDSLKPLQNMTKLFSLDICNTDIESGLEYLSNSVKEFLCLSSEREGAKSNLIADELRKFGDPIGEAENCIHLLEEWRKNNPEIILISRPELFINPNSDKDRLLTDFINKSAQNLEILESVLKRYMDEITSLKEKNSELEQELQIEREEIKKFQEKSEEYSLKQVEEIKKRDQQIKKLTEKKDQISANSSIVRPTKEDSSTLKGYLREFILYLEEKAELAEQASNLVGDDSFEEETEVKVDWKEAVQQYKEKQEKIEAFIEQKINKWK